MPNTYVTVEMIKEKMTAKQLIAALNENPALETTPNANRLQHYVDLANQSIDDALRDKYELPITGSDTVLVDIAEKIAAYEITMHKPRAAPSEGLDTLYNDAVSKLNAYRIGELSLDARPAPHKVPIATTRTRTGGMSQILANYIR